MVGSPLVVPFWDNFWNLSDRGLVPKHSVLSGGLSTSVGGLRVSGPWLSGVRHASAEAVTGFTQPISLYASVCQLLVLPWYRTTVLKTPLHFPLPRAAATVSGFSIRRSDRIFFASSSTVPLKRIRSVRRKSGIFLPTVRKPCGFRRLFIGLSFGSGAAIRAVVIKMSSDEL